MKEKVVGDINDVKQKDLGNCFVLLITCTLDKKNIKVDSKINVGNTERQEEGTFNDIACRIIRNMAMGSLSTPFEQSMQLYRGLFKKSTTYQARLIDQFMKYASIERGRRMYK